MSLDYVPLGEVSDITKLAGFEFTKYIDYLNYGEIIALRALNLRNGSLDLSDVKYISKEVSESLPRSKLCKNDILLTYTGNGYGDCAIVKENNKYHLAPNIAKITPKKINPYFLFEYINSKYFKKQMRNYIGGSSQPTIPMKTLRILEVPFPDSITQNKIAKILSEINEKIEINNKINHNLEEELSLIFDDWFVKCTPFAKESLIKTDLGYIPKSWKNIDFGDLIEITSGDRPKEKLEYKTTDFNIPLFGASKIMGYTKDFSYNENILIIGRVGTHGIVQRVNYPCFPSDNTFVIKSNYYGFVYQILKRIDYDSLNTGSTQPLITQKSLKTVNCIFPDENILNKFEDLSLTIFEEIFLNEKEINKLIKIRDTLLPKLMSGEINVSEINCDLD